ncbi:hypothetical protein M011DRAFT_490509 [Sporormia fimetaria CBS 119925]|uniref:Uncharacterized protein n=1 Tax=Sporormia fimetaria CBS 119925 TaxID=1340428 RepID=A0A6A6UYK7_9PLEO|nr:hypothetical protein M011DRAFT_490509 [Sporormia fimetaria CBS 119925]
MPRFKPVVGRIHMQEPTPAQWDAYLDPTETHALSGRDTYLVVHDWLFKGPGGYEHAAQIAAARTKEEEYMKRLREHNEIVQWERERGVKRPRRRFYGPGSIKEMKEVVSTDAEAVENGVDETANGQEELPTRTSVGVSKISTRSSEVPSISRRTPKRESASRKSQQHGSTQSSPEGRSKAKPWEKPYEGGFREVIPRKAKEGMDYHAPPGRGFN